MTALAAIVCAGCASSPRTWTKSEVPRSETDADLAQCRYEAKAATAGYHSTPTESDQKKTGGMGAAVGDGIVIAEKQVDLTNRCMRAKGYAGQ